MNLNDIIIVVGIAVFLLPVVYMLGYARRESQHGKTVQECKKNVLFQRNALTEMHQAEIVKERNVIRELEISLLKAGEAIEQSEQDVEKMTNRWAYADRYRAAIVELLHINHLWDFTIHGDNPMDMLAVLIKAEREEALDPAVSQKAKNLFVKGVRKGAKQGREQMRKLMQKSIDNQAATIRHYDECVQVSEKMRITYKTAVANVLNDKIALPGVRRALNQAIIQEHDRLRAVAKQKGE